METTVMNNPPEIQAQENAGFWLKVALVFNLAVLPSRVLGFGEWADIPIMLGWGAGLLGLAAVQGLKPYSADGAFLRGILLGMPGLNVLLVLTLMWRGRPDVVKNGSRMALKAAKRGAAGVGHLGAGAADNLSSVFRQALFMPLKAIPPGPPQELALGVRRGVMALILELAGLALNVLLPPKSPGTLVAAIMILLAAVTGVVALFRLRRMLGVSLLWIVLSPLALIPYLHMILLLPLMMFAASRLNRERAAWALEAAGTQVPTPE